MALRNIALWAGMWTPYAAITLKVLHLFDRDRNIFKKSYSNYKYELIGDQSTITPLVTIWPALIAKSASIWNPVVYAISHPNFRVVKHYYILNNEK